MELMDLGVEQRMDPEHLTRIGSSCGLEAFES